MKVSREQLENSQVKLQVEVEKEAVDRAVDQVYRKIAKEVTIPGFRRGRAPKHILTRYVGQDRLQQEALENLLQESYEKALLEAKVQPVDQPSIDIEEFEEGQEFRFAATVTVKPEAKIDDYQSIRVAPAIGEVTDEQVQSVVDSLLDDQSVLEPAADDDVFEAGKHATVMMEYLNDQDAPVNDKEYVIEFGSDQMFPGADEQLEGAKAGEERIITRVWPVQPEAGTEEKSDEPQSERPEGEGAEPTKPEEIKFKVMIKGLRLKQTPELNDEFVSSLELPVDTVEELRETIKTRLEANNEETAKQQQLEKIHEELLERTEVDIPEVMIENRVDRLLQDFTETLRRRNNFELDTYLTAVQQDKEEFRASFRQRAERSVKLDLALETIAAQQGIECLEDDLQQVMGSLAQGYQQAPEALRTMFQTEGFMEYLKSTVIMDKTNQLLVAQAAADNSVNEQTEVAQPEGVTPNQEVLEEDAK